MSEETAVAAPSAAAEAPKFTQFDGWDEDGTPVVSKKAEAAAAEKPAAADKPEGAESAAADASKETKTDDAADSAAKKTQEEKNHRKPGAEARIKELTARAKQLEKELEEARKPKPPAGEDKTKSADTPTARPEQKAAQPEATRPKPVYGDKGTDGKPKYATYEEFVEDLADWKAEQRIAAQRLEQQAQQMREAVNKKLQEARERYGDFETVTRPLLAEMLKPDMPPHVFAVINDSPVLPDLLYVLGGTDATKTDFLEACRANPGKALRVALLAEQEIVKELGKGKAAKKEGDGEAEGAPAAPKPRAPKPPTEVGGRGAPGEDALISAAKTGDFRSFEAEQTRRALASRR